MAQARGRPGVARLHLHFFAKPLEVVSDGSGHVAAFRWERTAPDGEGGVVGTGEMREIPVQAVYRAVGYYGRRCPASRSTARTA